MGVDAELNVKFKQPKEIVWPILKQFRDIFNLEDVRAFFSSPSSIDIWTGRYCDESRTHNPITVIAMAEFWEARLPGCKVFYVPDYVPVYSSFEEVETYKFDEKRRRELKLAWFGVEKDSS